MEKVNVENQPILTKIFNNINENKSNVQAYLLVGESKEKLREYTTLLSKILICPHKYQKGCNACNICERIDNNQYGELKIINPENNLIKKEVIQKLRDEFQTESIEGKNSVYIINDAETLHNAASNSILKFLEEPDSNTIAIFTTTNLDNVIKTIVSRCQIIKTNNFNKTYGLDFVKKVCNLDEENILKIVNYVKKIEKNPILSVVNIKNEFLDFYDNKEKMISAFNVILLCYKDMLNYRVKNSCSYFNEDDIKPLASNQTDNVISKKISFILENIAKLEYNVNVLLFMDNFIIGMGEIDDDKSSRN